MYLFMYLLGALVMAQRINRWLTNCWMDREGRAGKLEQPNEGRMGDLVAVFFGKKVGFQTSASGPP